MCRKIYKNNVLLALFLLFSTLSVLPTVFCSVGQVLNTTNVDSKMSRGVLTENLSSAFPENPSRAATADIHSAAVLPDVNDDVVKSSENSQILLPNNLFDEGEIKKNENVFGAISRPTKSRRSSLPSKPAPIPSSISLPSAENVNLQPKYDYDMWASNPVLSWPQATSSNQAARNENSIQNMSKFNKARDEMELQNQHSVMLYGVPVSIGHEADMLMVTHLLRYGLDIIIPVNMLACFRVGNFHKITGSRLLKIVFPSVEDKQLVLDRWRANWKGIRQQMWPGFDIQAWRNRAQRQQQWKMPLPLPSPQSKLIGY